MKKLLLFIIFCCSGYFLSAQNCNSLEGLPTDFPVLFPLPAGVIPAAQGGVGINTTAKIGEPYSYTWTLSVPKNFEAGGVPTVNDSSRIIVDSVYYERNGVITTGLPEGLSLVGEPSNFWLSPTDSMAAVGCFAITGTPSENVEPGDYNIFFVLQNCVSVTGFSGCLNSTIPSAAAMIPGLYTLTIEAGDPPVVVNCNAIEGLPTDFPVLFPLPAGVIPAAQGGIGINTTAKIGEPFSYTWTLSVPKNFMAGGVPTVNDSSRIIPDSVYYERNGVITSGLPEGLSLVGEPSDFWLSPTDSMAAVGCFAITGTPSENVEPGDYNIFFVLQNCVSVTGFSGCLNSTVPSAAAMIPGLYTLTIEAGDPPVAVNCNAIEGLPTDFPVLFPLPAGVIPAAQGGIGINTTAKIGEPFSYTWTLSVPKNFMAGGVPTVNDSSRIIPDSVYYERNGVITPGLPEGLSLVGEPSGFWLSPTDSMAAVGCFAITGTPSENVEPGDYNIFFVLQNCVSVTGFSGCLNSTVPSAAAMIPGLYTLTIEGTVSSTNEVAENIQLEVFPNPFSELATISLNSNLTGDFKFRVFDLLGKQVHTRAINLIAGKNTIQYNGSGLDNGIYIYTIENELGAVSGKMVLKR